MGDGVSGGLESVIDGGEGGGDGGFRAEDAGAERNLRETSGEGARAFVAGPAAFRADGENGTGGRAAGFQNVAKRRGARGFGEKQEDGAGIR